MDLLTLRFQYAEYAGVAAPTPHTPPPAVMGGQGAPEGEPDPEHTSAYVVKPEPGRDIFAGVQQDARSKARPPPPAVDADSIVNAAEEQMTTATEPTAESSESTAESSLSSVESSDSASSSAASSEGASSSEGANAKPAKPAGPKGEAELEAEKVAQELYPDAVEK